MSNEETFKSVDDILKHYKKREEMVFKRTEDVIEYFGWGRPINLVEVRKDESSANRSKTLRTAGADRKPERDADGDVKTGVPDEQRHCP